MTASPSYATGLPPSKGELLVGLVVGLVMGLVVVYLLGSELRYAIYGLAALLAALALPKLVQRAGSLERLLFVLLVVALQIDVALAFSFRQYKPAGPYGYLVSPSLLAAAGLLGARFALSARRLGTPLRLDTPLLRAAGAMLLAGLLSSINASDRQLVAFGLLELLTVSLIAVAAADQCSTREGLRTVQRILAWTLVVQSLLILVGFATGVQISLSRGARGADYGWSSSGRFAGTLSTPSAAGTMLLVCLLAALSRLPGSTGMRQRAWLYLQLGLGSFALLLTQTRTAWIGLLLGGAGVLGSAYRRGDLRGGRLLALCGVALVALLVAWPFIAGRVSASHSDDADIRWRLVLIAAEMIKSHPFIGIGLNTATQKVAFYAAQAGVGGWVFIVHDQFLLVWAETGLLGILGFVALFWLGLSRASQLRRAADLELRDTGVWLFWCFIALIWALNMDHVSGAPTYKLVFFLIGAAAGASRLVASSDEPRSAPAQS